MGILKSIALRRSIYSLGNDLSKASEKKAIKAVREALLHCPTAFNSQSSRVVVLLNGNHRDFWDITRDALKATLSDGERIQKMEEKIRTFQDGYGTILYYDDVSTIRSLENDYPLYKDNFAVWANQANGMLQMIIWTALAEAKIGSSLQHYNPVVDGAAQKRWNVNPNWKLVAQMPFGSIKAKADPKSKIDLAKRMVLFA